MVGDEIGRAAGRERVEISVVAVSLEKKDVVLGFPPAVLLMTLKVTVQLLLAGIVMPVKLRTVAPALKVEGVVPAQVPPTAPPTALMLDNVSVNARPVRVAGLLFDNVRVTTELPPD